jgi:septal ring factor EnvC (AmiA/AmiB activator)
MIISGARLQEMLDASSSRDVGEVSFIPEVAISILKELIQRRAFDNDRLTNNRKDAEAAADVLIEKQRALIEKSLAPLLERIDLVEHDARNYRDETDELQEKLRVAAHNKEEMRHDDAKRRFRAGLAIELLQNYPMGLNDQERERDVIENALGMVDAVLKKVGL